MSQENFSNSTPKPYPEADLSEQVGKVAEGVAAYSYTPVKKSISPQHFIAGISVADEVWRFANMNQLAPHLETAVKLVRELFPKVGGVQFTYEIDPEIENESYIIMRVKVQGIFDDLVRADWAYTEKIVRAVPLDKLPLFSFFPEVV